MIEHRDDVAALARRLFESVGARRESEDRFEDDDRAFGDAIARTLARVDACDFEGALAEAKDLWDRGSADDDYVLGTWLLADASGRVDWVAESARALHPRLSRLDDKQQATFLYLTSGPAYAAGDVDIAGEQLRHAVAADPSVILYVLALVDLLRREDRASHYEVRALVDRALAHAPDHAVLRQLSRERPAAESTTRTGPSRVRRTPGS